MEMTVAVDRPAPWEQVALQGSCRDVVVDRHGRARYGSAPSLHPCGTVTPA
jgi:hypothetical protein